MSNANYNSLISKLRHRLASGTKAQDEHGNVINCDIYATDQLVAFIELALSEFNSIPKFTNFTLDNDKFVTVFGEILVEGATLYALSSKALIERGREFTNINDNGLSFDVPNISELLNTQFHLLLEHHFEKLKLIKENISEWSY